MVCGEVKEKHMTTYYAKQIDESGEVVALHKFSTEAFPTSKVFVQIEEDEYTVLLAEMQERLKPKETDQISDSEALNIMLGGVSDDER